MKDQGEVFQSNTLLIVIPGIFFGAALILRSQEDLYALMWIFLAIGLITTTAIVSSFTTLIITDELVSIKNLKKSQSIHLNEIAKQSKSISNAKGIESIVWKLYLKNGSNVKISSDLFKDKERLKESLGRFLKRIPEK